MSKEKENRIIAEFMGLPTVKAAPLRGGEYYDLYNIQSLPPIYIKCGSTGINATIQTRLLMATADQLAFDTSWDWLMPVVEKIEEMGYIFMIGKHEAGIAMGRSSGLPRESGNNVKADSKIGAAYQSIIQFITWYNNNPNERTK